MWKNKHLIVAMLVTPILAILAWYAVGAWVGEKPHAAKPGGAYKLVARSNCRYESGQCDLFNNDFKLKLKPGDLATGATVLSIDSEFALDQATLALVVNGAETTATADPVDFNPPSKTWAVTIPATAQPGAILRVAVTSHEALYYAEVPVIFMTAED